MGSVGGNKYTISIGFGDNITTYNTDKTTKEFSEKLKSNSSDLILADTRQEILGKVRDFYRPYQDGIASEDNFYIDTIAEFKTTRRPRRPPDFVSRTRDGKVSSEYWYTEEGVIRGSKHWGGWSCVL